MATVGTMLQTRITASKDWGEDDGADGYSEVERAYMQCRLVARAERIYHDTPHSITLHRSGVQLLTGSPSQNPTYMTQAGPIMLMPSTGKQNASMHVGR